MTKSVGLSYEEIARYFEYSPEEGTLLRRERSGQRGAVGSDATTVKKTTDGRGQVASYRWVWLHGCTIPAARVAWMLGHHKWPETRVLFKNGDTLDLRLENLGQGTFKAYASVGTDGKKYWTRTRQDSREYHLKNNYGLTMGEHERMLASQGGVCKICKQPEIRRHKDGSVVALHVDHCHETGKVRGLLCHKCNVGIGSFDEDPIKLAEALVYVKKECAPLVAELLKHSDAGIVPFVPKAETK